MVPRVLNVRSANTTGNANKIQSVRTVAVAGSVGAVGCVATRSAERDLRGSDRAGIGIAGSESLGIQVSPWP